MVSIYTDVDIYGPYDKLSDMIEWLKNHVGMYQADWDLYPLPGHRSEIIIWDDKRATLAQLRWTASK